MIANIFNNTLSYLSQHKDICANTEHSSELHNGLRKALNIRKWS